MIGGLNWVQIAWPMMAAACLTLGAIHLSVWLKQRRHWAHLMFAGSAFTVALIASFELAYMHAASVERAVALLRWGHLYVFLLVLFLVGFARFQFGGVRRWLLAVVLLSRALVFLLAILLPNGVNYERVDALRQIDLPGGARVSVLAGVASPWTFFASLSWLLVVALIADAALGTWRRSPPALRGRIARVATAIVVFLLISPLLSYLLHTGLLRIPYFITPVYCLVILAMATDLTADIVRTSELSDGLRASEARLRESESNRELAVDAAALALWSLDSESRTVHVSGRFREIFGLDGDPPFALETILARIHPDDLEDIRTAIPRSFAAEAPVAREFRVRSRGGDWRWIRGQGRSDTASDPVQARLHGVCYDITELRVAKERFQTIVDSAPSAILIVDASGRITFANQRASILFAFPHEELVSATIDQLVPERLRSTHALHRAQYSERPGVRLMGAGMEIVGRRRDGSEFPIEVSLAPLPGLDGDRVLALVSDISLRRQQELGAAHQRAELAHLSRVALLGELSASIAHEINQPLAAILSNAQAAQRYLARDPVDLALVREIIGDIAEDDKRAGEVIRRLRAMLRKEELPRGEIDLNEIARSVLQIVHGDLLNRGIRVENLLADEPAPVIADLVQLQQVLLNLILNACDAMGDRPQPRTLTLRTTRDSGEALLEVRDRGTGIPEPELSRIFEPFVTSKAQGTGLGLSVCRTIVASHGGRIWARNNPEGGATFAVALPAAPQPSA